MRVDDERQEPAYPAGGAPGSVDEDSGRSPETAAHPGWAPPEHYTPTGERRGEPPGPVETGGHYDPGPGEQPGTGAEEAAAEDVDGGEFPPDDYLEQRGESGTDGTTYGHPAAEATGDAPAGGAPVGEGSARRPAGGGAHAPPGAAAGGPRRGGPDVSRGSRGGAPRQRGELDRWQGAELDDTEELRVTVRRYRDLLDRLLAL